MDTSQISRSVLNCSFLCFASFALPFAPFALKKHELRSINDVLP